MITSTLIAVLVVSLIAGALAAVLVVAEYYLANYGPCKITVNDEKELTVEGGKDLLALLTAQKLFIPSACGGRATCGLCKVKVLEGAGPLLPTEEPYLDQTERESNVRLACQVKVRSDLKIEIPKELFAIQEYTCRCAKIVELTHDMKLFRLELTEPATMDYIPGQYVQLRTPPYGKSRKEVYRAYSIASDPAEKGIIELIIRLVPGGICTTYCFEHLKEGDEMRLNGPYGDFQLSESQAPMVFIAGGSGMAPIKCMLHHMKNTNNARRAEYYFGANAVKELCLIDLMQQFESELADFHFVPVVASTQDSPEWDGETGLVTEAVRRGLTDASQHEAYLCGSPGMIDACVKVLMDLGMPETSIFYDKFA
ncbi:MAG: 2Fe-2S iron-sulfur cluster binding domain-containing protein [Sedimentisphaerales bacterium]|jgi:Na+-transporting NADH:ubiquinone oxidoreductase subunit F|nr:2Fe-2S iron-sulfur cluster binding domain-containing protein [Sedimentisphaerales bacterium]NLT75712.1 2Fe-2S iron-sulfur cluster binding domain-containing protein [Planctomycetota bacterium]